MTRTGFEAFDQRGYRTVDTRAGYAAWAPTYEQTVEHAMDLDLLEALTTVDWPSTTEAADLGCGTGRTGAWLQEQGVRTIDGVDLTSEMLALAEARGIYRVLAEADVTATGLPSAAYDLITTSLVDEHLETLGPLYREAHQLASPIGATYVLVGFHPHFIMRSGMPTHFDAEDGEPVAIETHVHQLADHITAGLEAGWRLTEMRERLIDDPWIALKPKWEVHRGHPISFALAWRRDPA
jgi:SAM-dependent methyltransferase